MIRTTPPNENSNPDLMCKNVLTSFDLCSSQLQLNISIYSQKQTKSSEVRWWRWGHIPLIPVLQRQEDFCEFKASLVHREFQDSQDTQKPCLGKKNETKPKMKQNKHKLTNKKAHTIKEHSPLHSVYSYLPRLSPYINLNFINSQWG